MGTYCERGNCSRQFEAPRSSTAGIDKENPAPFFDYRPMGMAGDDSRESRGMRIEVELRQVMKNVDFLAANLDDVVCGKTARPSAYRYCRAQLGRAQCFGARPKPLGRRRRRNE